MTISKKDIQINEEIRDKELRVISSDGQQLGIMSSKEALALAEQKNLLTLKKERLERLILAIDRAVEGENIMNAFDNSEFEKYKAENLHIAF